MSKTVSPLVTHAPNVISNLFFWRNYQWSILSLCTLLPSSSNIQSKFIKQYLIRIAKLRTQTYFAIDNFGSLTCSCATTCIWKRPFAPTNSPLPASIVGPFHLPLSSFHETSFSNTISFTISFSNTIPWNFILKLLTEWNIHSLCFVSGNISFTLVITSCPALVHMARDFGDHMACLSNYMNLIEFLLILE